MNASVHPNHRAICHRLLQTGTLPRSECGRALVRALKPLFDSGVIRWEKAAGGQRLAVTNVPAFQRWFRQHFPDGQLSEDAASSRVRAVAQYRDSKALRSNLPVLVCLRSTRDGGLLRDGVPVETTRATKEHGVFAFTLTNPTVYSLQGTCALIENLAVFQSFERLPLEAALAIWTTGGTNSNRFLDWLASNIQRGLRILHLPDYDPVGLTEFLRHYKRLGDAVTLYLPDDLPALFSSHSNASLLTKQKNQRLLMALRKSEHPIVRQVVALMDECNRGLEHEATLIGRKPT